MAVRDFFARQVHPSLRVAYLLTIFLTFLNKECPEKGNGGIYNTLLDEKRLPKVMNLTDNLNCSLNALLTHSSHSNNKIN